MPNYPVTPRNAIKRLPKRGNYDPETIYAILDEALICHVAFVENGQPVVIPCLFGRQGNELLLHGAKASRLMKHMRDGGEVSVAVSLIDGLVVARSVFHHSVNYRSVVIFGAGRAIETPAEKMQALEVITEHILPGRWAQARTPNRKEMNATMVVAIPIESASAKIRTGGPGDDEADYALPIWAGVLPLTILPGAPIDDPLLTAGIPVPPNVTAYRRGR